MRKSRFPLMALAATLCAASAAHAQEQFYTGEQIMAMWGGKKIFTRSATGGLADLHLRQDGTAHVSIGNLNDNGTWRATAEGYCAKWQQIRQGAEACFRVVKRGDRTFTLDSAGNVTAEVLRIID